MAVTCIIWLGLSLAFSRELNEFSHMFQKHGIDFFLAQCATGDCGWYGDVCVTWFVMIVQLARDTVVKFMDALLQLENVNLAFSPTREFPFQVGDSRS